MPSASRRAIGECRHRGMSRRSFAASRLLKTGPAGLFALFLIFSGCSTPGPEFTVWVGGAPQEVDYWERLVREFERESGVASRLVRQPTDSDQRRQGLVVSLESRQPDPDVFFMDVVWLGQFVLSGWLEPLSPFLQRDGVSVDPFFDGIIRLVDRYGETLFALPVYIDAGLLYYRMDLLSRHGIENPPETWEELRKAAEMIQAEERRANPQFNGFVWPGAQYEGLVCTFLEFASSNRGGITSRPSIEVDTPQNVQALGFMRDLIHQYQISPPHTFTEMKEEEVRRAFQQGEALFERNWPYAWQLHQDEASPVRGKVGIAPLPHFAGGHSAAALGGWHIGISRHTDAAESAWRFVRYVTSFETQKALALELGWNPGRRDVYGDPEVVRRLPHLERLREVFEHAVARPRLPYYTLVSEVIQRHVNSCLAGNAEPEQALHDMQRDIDDISRYYQQR